MMQLVIYELLTKFAAVNCANAGKSTFFGFPAWYRGLKVQRDTGGFSSCTVYPDSLNDIWIIAVNIIEILSRLAAYIAIGMIIYGGIMFVISQGNPEKISTAKSTVLYAVVGLVISISAVAITSYVVGIL